MCECVTPWSRGDQYQSCLLVFLPDCCSVCRIVFCLSTLCVDQYVQVCLQDFRSIIRISWFSDQIVVQFVGLYFVCVPAALARAGQKMVSDARASSHGKTEPLKTTVSVCLSFFQFLCLCVSMCVLSFRLSFCLSLSPTVCISKRAIRGVACTSLRLVPLPIDHTRILIPNSNPKFQYPNALGAKLLRPLTLLASFLGLPRCVLCKHFICISSSSKLSAFSTCCLPTNIRVHIDTQTCELHRLHTASDATCKNHNLVCVR